MASGEGPSGSNTQVAWATTAPPAEPPRSANDSNPDAALPPPRIAGRYTIQAQIGLGGMGAVYVVFDHDLDEVVALKMLRPELASRAGLAQRFRQEVKLARRVTHPNVVRTFDLGEFVTDDGTTQLFLTMEYVDGRPLSHRIAEEGPLAPDRITPILAGICAGLAAAHDAGVVHRDLKPDNVLVATDGRVVLTDFGIARAVRTSDSLHTQPGLIGTPVYMAPEQASGGTVDHRADLYALGAIVYELATGAPPFTGDDPQQVALARVLHPPPDPRTRKPGLSLSIAGFLLRALARDPVDRFSTASELRDAWDRAAAGTAPADPLAVRASLLPPATVPSPTSFLPDPKGRTLAVLPFRSADPADAPLARGFCEELVDAFSMTRGLRVRPLGKAADDDEPREIGRRLGVEIVVEGSIRRTAAGYRVGLRTVSVADGYVLGAWRFESADPLGLVDDAALTVAKALTVELPSPSRQVASPEAVDLYLRGKSALRDAWFQPIGALTLLTQAHALAPDDPDILAAYATGLARTGLFASSDQPVVLGVARSEAERAVSLGPDRAEGWFALGVARIYSSDLAGGAEALRNALARAPGHAQAQHALGSLLLEAGVVTEAMARLNAAVSLDPSSLDARLELARAHALLGDWNRAWTLLSADPGRKPLGRAIVWSRLRLWNPQLAPAPPLPPPDDADEQPFVRHVVEFLQEIVATGKWPASSDRILAEGVEATAGRLHTVRLQYKAEAMLFLGEPDRALAAIGQAATQGMVDLLWLERCPLVTPLRGNPDLERARRIVADRADAVARAVGARIEIA
jgi:serine/threonine-protein kinase